MAVLCERACKPGSVENDHLSRPAVAGRFKPPPEDGRAGHVSSHGVAPDRVYSAPLLPGGRVSSYLAFPPLLPDPVFRTGRQRYISVALFLRSLWADVIRYPCPAEPGLSSQAAFRHCLRDCLAYSRKYFIGLVWESQDLIEKECILQYN